MYLGDSRSEQFTTLTKRVPQVFRRSKKHCRVDINYEIHRGDQNTKGDNVFIYGSQKYPSFSETRHT